MTLLKISPVYFPAHPLFLNYEFMLAIKKRMTTKEMSELIYAHPSFSEAIQNALEKIQGLSIA